MIVTHDECVSRVGFVLRDVAFLIALTLRGIAGKSAYFSNAEASTLRWCYSYEGFAPTGQVHGAYYIEAGRRSFEGQAIERQ